MTKEITITTSVFDRGARIPPKYTCDGENVSPPLSWSAGPAGTASYVLILDDPDAPNGTWVHWVAWNIAANTLAEALPREKRLADGMSQGKNSWGKHGYGGPCPPAGEHRYFFKVYALDTKLELEPSTDKSALLAAMQGHVLGEGETFGVYTRTKR